MKLMQIELIYKYATYGMDIITFDEPPSILFV
jgi:hypothetical protein